jgi:hypothetical protein
MTAEVACRAALALGLGVFRRGGLIDATAIAYTLVFQGKRSGPCRG